VPFERNPRFTGRKPQLAEIEGKLFTRDHTAKIAITGLGGVGKTQLVLELLYLMKDKHKHCLIIWIPATNGESLHQAYRDVARQLRIPGWEEERADVKRLVQGHLSRDDAGQWLIVFDNADDIDMWIAKAGSKQESEEGSRGLVDYLPSSGQGSIIFTTRDRQTASKLARQNVVEIPEMDEEAATQLLQKCLINPDLVNNRHDTAVLLAELTYLPLAIAQAAAFINENGITLGCYLSLLAEQEEEVIALLSEEFEDDGRYRNIKNPVATTWLISFEQIQQRNSLAAQYLSFMSCVDPKGIPQSLLPPGSSRKEETEAIGTLDAYSFVSRRPADPVLDLHRLVHLATRNWLRKERKLAQWTERVIVRLQEVFPDDDHKNRSVWRRYLPHARYALQADLIDKDWTCRMDLIWKYGLCLDQDGQWDEAEVAFTQVLETRKRVHGPDHPATLASMSNLAATYCNQGRWNEAEKLGVQVMEMRKAVLGAEHPNTLNSMMNLASAYSEQGRWTEAEKLEMQVMEVSMTVLGAKHPFTLTSMANLASTYWRQGRWDEAKKLDAQVMETSKAVLGAEHPDTLTSMANLASTYQSQGRWDEAEKLHMQVIEIRKTVLGAEHPDTLTSMANLASTNQNQGRWNEAEKLQVQVMETSKAVLGAEHPDTLTSMANLASTHQNQGRLDEAEKLHMQVIEIRKTVLGAEHPDTLTSMANLASTYQNQGRLDEAEKLQMQIMKTSKSLLGAEHPDTLTSMANLASTHQNQGRLDEAEKLHMQVIEIRKTVLGAEHPGTLTSMANLASTYQNQGRWNEAEKLQVQVMETSRAVLGAEHPDTLTTIANLALAYWCQGRWNEAEKLEVQVMEIRKTVLGAEHPDTLTSMANLAHTWKLQRRLPDALALLEACCQLRNKVLGPDHPDTSHSFRTLGNWRYQHNSLL
jgi:tetratricopeptide (TPR) repeat protein